MAAPRRLAESQSIMGRTWQFDFAARADLFLFRLAEMDMARRAPKMPIIFGGDAKPAAPCADRRTPALMFLLLLF